MAGREHTRGLDVDEHVVVDQCRPPAGGASVHDAMADRVGGRDVAKRRDPLAVQSLFTFGQQRLAIAFAAERGELQRGRAGVDRVDDDSASIAVMDSQFNLLDRYWRAANYLTVGQIYLLANPLLREPLTADHIKPRLLGHWGTSPGLSFVYAHLNRLIRERDANVIYIAGPGHGGPALVANVYLEGTYSEVYPEITENEDGMLRLFRQFSTPGGIPSHVSAPTPGSIHEGGELGLRAGARVRRRVRQPRPDRRVRHRRRRSRDRSARGVVEGRALPASEPRRRGAADPPPQRLQDQRTDGARPHRRRRRGRLAARTRLRRRRRRRRRSGDDARAVRRRARCGAHTDP